MVELAQPSSEAPQRERLPVWRTLGGMFQMFGTAPLFFVGLAVPLVLPNLVRLALQGSAADQRLSWSMLPSTVVGFLILFFVYAAMSYFAVRAREGARPSATDALAVGLRRFLPMLAVALLSLLAFYVGLILLVVPGVIAACMFAVSIPVCAAEPLGPIASMRRSAALTKGSRWRILWITIIYFVPLAAFGFADFFLLLKAGHPLAAALVNASVSLFTTPLAIILGAEMYVGLRRLKENIGVASVFD